MLVLAAVKMLLGAIQLTLYPFRNALIVLAILYCSVALILHVLYDRQDKLNKTRYLFSSFHLGMSLAVSFYFLSLLFNNAEEVKALFWIVPIFVCPVPLFVTAVLLYERYVLREALWKSQGVGLKDYQR